MNLQLQLDDMTKKLQLQLDNATKNVSVFSALANNRMVKIAHFWFRSGHVDN
jgi:hypothetical protein